MLDMDVLTDEQRHINMLHIRSKDTKPEILLRKALWHFGIRYRKNYFRKFYTIFFQNLQLHSYYKSIRK